jgi:adenylate cyclase
VAIVPVLVTLLHVTGWVRLTPLDWVDNLIYDMRLRATMPRTLDERIVIVDIDEKSLAEQGRWPWSRAVLADLTDRLFDEQHVAVLGFDMVFAEPEPSSNLPLPDDRFAHSMAGRRVVLGHYFSSDRQGRHGGQLPRPVMNVAGLRGARVVSWTGFGANLPGLMDAAWDGGAFNALVDDDGVVRAVPLLSEYQGQIYTSFALSVFRALLGSAAVEPGFAGDGVDRVVLRQAAQALAISVDARLSTLVPYRGPGGPSGGSYAYVSASDLLHRRLPANALQGKVVLVGTSVPGLQDVRVTPAGPAYPGVEVHANLISGFLDGTAPSRPDYSPGYELVVVTLSGVLLAAVLPLLSAWSAVGLLLGVWVGLGGLNTWLYWAHGLVMPMAGSLFMVGLSFGLHMAHGYLTESRAKRHLAQLFGNYVPPELVNEMVKDPGRYTMQAEERELTVMFCDLQGFTQMAEHLPPATLQALLNHVFNQLSQVIRAHGGTIDKYMGDCVMAFWGAPVACEDHARQAVMAALAMVDATESINHHGQSVGWPFLRVGVGINTGKVLVGDMGSDLRRAYTVIGDPVNVAARLQALTRVQGVGVLVGETTQCQAARIHPQEWLWTDRGREVLRGKEGCVRVFAVNRDDHETKNVGARV